MRGSKLREDGTKILILMYSSLNLEPCYGVEELAGKLIEKRWFLRGSVLVVAEMSRLSECSSIQGWAERNFDVDTETSYAPLLCNLNHHQWRLDLKFWVKKNLSSDFKLKHYRSHCRTEQTDRSVSHSVMDCNLLISSVRIVKTLTSSLVMASNQNIGLQDLISTPTHMYSRLHFCKWSGALPLTAAFAAMDGEQLLCSRLLLRHLKPVTMLFRAYF
jgi:hypothetical protein